VSPLVFQWGLSLGYKWAWWWVSPMVSGSVYWSVSGLVYWSVSGSVSGSASESAYWWEFQWEYS